jgi:hypothetical protein
MKNSFPKFGSNVASLEVSIYLVSKSK